MRGELAKRRGKRWSEGVRKRKREKDENVGVVGGGGKGTFIHLRVQNA